MKERFRQHVCQSKGLRHFHFLSEEEKKILFEYLECRNVIAGEVLWQEGASSDSLVFVINGRIHMKKETEFPGKEIIVGVYSRGSILGEASFLDNSPRPLTAKAYEKSDVGILSRENFDDIVENHPGMALNLFKGIILSLSSRLKQSFERLASVF
jgi:CRP-like cAMP-binding protein